MKRKGKEKEKTGFRRDEEGEGNMKRRIIKPFGTNGGKKGENETISLKKETTGWESEFGRG